MKNKKNYLGLKLIKKNESIYLQKNLKLYLGEILKKKNSITSVQVNKNLDKVKKNNGKIYWISSVKKKIGFLIIYINNKKKIYYIRDLFILTKYRKKNIGTKIIKKIIRSCLKKKIKFIKIDIIDSNKKIIKFWSKFNFKKINKSYYLEIKNVSY